MNDKTTDPVAQLGQQLAADHVLDKARAAGEQQAEPASSDADEEPAETSGYAEPLVDNDDEARFIGDFASFEEARAFLADDGDDFQRGDMTVVNGGLVRTRADGSFEVIVSSLLDEYAPPADHTERFARSLSDLERIVLEADFESGPLLGGLRDTMLALFKARPKGWNEMSEMEKKDLAKQLESQAATIIRKVARVVAEGEEISVTGKLESFNCKGGFDLKISAPGDEEAVVQLYRMTGHEVVIMSADAERFLTATAPEVEPDEPGLPFADPPAAEASPEPAYVPPADDSDLAGDADEDEDDVIEDDETAAAETLADIDGPLAGSEPGEYEGRSNPDDEPDGDLETGSADDNSELGQAIASADPDFVEATAEELAAQVGRSGSEPAGDATAKADYVGPREPEDAVPGESWIDTSREDQRPRFKHPNGKFYLSPPTAEVLEAWRAGNNPAAEESADENGFPADPA